MSAHTPGPWTQCDRIVVVCPPSHEYSTWIANASVGGNSAAEQLANTQLIAAAPELLTWLRWSLKHLSDDKKQSGQYDMACAVLLKAGGEKL